MVPYLRAANVKDGSLDLDDVKSMDFSPAEQKTFGLRPGDVLVSEGSGSLAAVGASAVWSGELDKVVCYQNTLLRLRPRPGGDPRYLMWWARHAFGSGLFASIAGGANIYHLGAERVRLLPAAMPDLRGQRAIADYLDTEAARIDALTAAKGSLLGLMLERRRAHIDWLLGQSVDAKPRVDVPWLSRVPGDWPSVPLGLLADVFSGSTPSTDRVTEGDVAWTTSGELDQGIIRQPTSYISAAVLEASGLRIAPAGSVVVGLVGQGRTRGLSATLGIDTTLNQNIAAIVPRDCRLDAGYLALLLTLAYDDLRSGGRGGNQAALNSELLRSYRIPLAHLKEQRRLLEIARVEREAEEHAIDLQHRSIDLLRERRQALITAAVTGQLEIPGVAA